MIRSDQGTTRDPLPRLGERAIRARVGDRTFERGAGYFQWGAVFDGRREGGVLKARCEGASGETYRVRVRLDLRGVTEADCSCPIGEGGRCKHTAAVLLTYGHRPEEFVEVESADAALGRLDRDALLALARQVLARRPELEPLYETLVAQRLPPPPRPAETWRSRAAAVFRRHGAEGGAAGALAHDLRALLSPAEAMLQGHDALGAAAVYEQVASAVLGRHRRLHDEAGELAAVAAECVEALGRCLAALAGDGVGRRAVLRVLFDLYRFEVEQGAGPRGGHGVGRGAAALAAARATPEERRALAAWAREAMERADEWARRAWAALRLDLEADTLDDDTLLALARSTGRVAPVVRRLLAQGRAEEAEREATRAGDAELLALAEDFTAAGQGDGAERLIATRAERSADPRLGDWLRTHAGEQVDALAQLEVAERLFRARPDRAGYDALQAQAAPLGRWEALRAGTHAFLAERAPALLAEVSLAEGAVAEAVAAAQSERCRGPAGNAVRLKVAEVAEATDLHAAIELYRRHAEGLIHDRGRANYRAACRVMQKVRALHDRLGEPGAYARYLAELRARHGALPALQEEIAAHLDADAAE